MAFACTTFPVEKHSHVVLTNYCTRRKQRRAKEKKVQVQVQAAGQGNETDVDGALQ